MKRKGEKPSTDQLRWLEMLKGQGFKTKVCWNWEEASNLILNYLEG